MNEPAHKLFGEHDQEVLFKAFAHFVANTTKKSMNIIVGMLRLCIQEVVESNKMSIPETKKLDENVRRKLLETGIDEFLKRAKVGSVHRHEIRKGCLSIYERWHTIRSSIREEATIQIEEILEEPTSSIIGYAARRCSWPRSPTTSPWSPAGSASASSPSSGYACWR